MTKLSGHELQSKGARLREDDKHTEALHYLTLALVAHQKEKNYRGMVNTLKDRCLTWKHLFLLTKDRVYAILAQKDAEAMLAISQQSKLKDKLHTSYFRLGEVAMLFADYLSAINYYEKALRYYVGPLAEKGDYRYHLGEAFYQNGQKEKGKRMILAGLKEVQKGADKVNSFLIHVWESGCHLRLADLLKDDEPKEARKHLELAREIADNDPKLVIRRRQIEELARSFS
jgi:tetratricopeptide (TPR) repeat protein